MTENKQKMYKNSLMGEAYLPITDTCKYCYGFSNWSGNKDNTPYEGRDCSKCGNKPQFQR